MICVFPHRFLSPLSCIAALSVALLSSGYAAAAQAPDAAAHKQWMNDASDAQDDYRFAVGEKNQQGAVEALTKLEALMGRTEEYWTARKADDAVKLARQSRALAAQAAAAARSGNMSASGEAFDKMGATCNSCHDLHLEKR
jgi:hypothetical protein